MAGNSEAGLQSVRRISAVVAILIVGVCGIVSAQDWRSQDLGGAGSAAENNGVWTIKAAGSDIWGTADSFQFLFHPANLQSGRLTVRVDDLQNTNAFAKSGLMLRSGLEDVSSANVILDVKPSGEVEFMARATDGGETAYLA